MKKLVLVALLLVQLVGARAAELPSEEDLKAMTDQSLLLFNAALQKEDFTAFYQATAELWQKQTTPAKLQEIFTKNIDPGFEFSAVVQGMDPVFEPEPAIDSDDVLVAQGYYTTKPKRLTFRLKYFGENGAWKLVGFTINTVDAPKDEDEDEASSSEKK